MVLPLGSSMNELAYDVYFEEKQEGQRMVFTSRECPRWLYAGVTPALMVIQMLAVLCALAQPAYAYVDPGGGILSLQIISSTCVGMIFLIRRRLRGFLKKMNGSPGSKSEKAN